MRIAVTGANGYVGSSLVRHLSNEYEVVGITRKECDLTNSESVNNFFNEKEPFDFVIHCAIIGGSRETVDDSFVTHNNLVMFNNLMSLKGIRFTSIINIGSGAEYDRRYPINRYEIENNNRIPIDPYGMSKFYINQLIQNTSNSYTLRVFGLFDENELDRRFIKSCLTNYIQGKPILLYKNVEMDFMYMDDFVSMVRMILNNRIPSDIKSFDCVYNSRENPRELENIAQTYINETLDGVTTPIEHVEEFKPNFNRSYLGIPPTWMDQTGLIGLKDGIRRTYEKMKVKYEQN
jgi:nucleoside-diphosphate-sugar epimerase